ncbi:MAG TPA: prenyltransferase [Thermoanaerobaculia bacterium]
MPSRVEFWAGVYRLSDPKISLASFSAMFLGAGAAAHDGRLSAPWLVLTVLGIWAIEIAKNASGEIYDWDSGTDRLVAPQDRSPFSGGKRVLLDGLLTRRQTADIALVGYFAGILAGVAIVRFREPEVLWLGVIGVACAFFYHAPPLKLSYRGLGELAVAFCYGPLICAGTYFVQRGSVRAPILLLSIPLGLLIAAFLWINEFPDARADGEAGKRTLVVRLGKRRASRAYVILLILAFAMLASLPLAGLPRGVWLGGIALLPAAWSARALLAEPENTPGLVPAQASALLAFLLLALGAGLGLLLF